MSTERDKSEIDIVEAEIRRVCAILESVAAGFAPDSEESLAIRDAALAFQKVQLNAAMRKSYEKLRSGRICDNDWDELKAKLRSHGIGPDELDDDPDNPS